MELKSHMNLELQMANLPKRWHWEQGFNDLVDLTRIQQVMDTFDESTAARHKQDMRQQLNVAQDCFQLLGEVSMDIVGRAFILFQQVAMLRNKTHDENGQIEFYK